MDIHSYMSRGHRGLINWRESLSRDSRRRTMEKIGYLLSEAPIFFFVLWFGIRLVHIRRYRNKQPIFTERDWRLLYESAKLSLVSPLMRLRLARSILAATAAIHIEILVLAPFGAGILSAAILLTTASIVQRILLADG